MPVSRPSSFGFTLIELSVVLVIIGLLAGAVVGGQAMIRSAELQSIVSDYTRYKDAVTTFKKQYNSLPGDMVDAQDFWGQSTACSGADATGTCNGDGDVDHTISYGLGANATGEAFQFWRQLAAAGRIIGTYSGVSGSGGIYHSIRGTNVPAGRIGGSAWNVGGTGTAQGSVFTVTTGNYFLIGAETTTSQSTDALLSPEEAWKLDTKLDDGKPGHGSIISSNPVNQCALAANAADLDAAYNLSENTKQCALFFIDAMR